MENIISLSLIILFIATLMNRNEFESLTTQEEPAIATPLVDDEVEVETSEKEYDNEVENEEEVVSDAVTYTPEEIRRLKQQQNLPLGVITGLVTCIGVAILWGVITVVTGYQIGYMAIAVGFAVGFAMRKFGKGVTSTYGIIGAVLALFGCLLGNFFSVVGFISQEMHTGITEAISMVQFSMIPSLMMETFSPIDLLFYGIALYSGYKYSFTELKEEF